MRCSLKQSLKTNEERYRVTNSLIGFIGITYVVMGSMNFMFNFDKVFIISATIAGFFFVIADIYTSSHSMSKIENCVYVISTVAAVASFVILPAVLMKSEKLLNSFNTFSDSATIITLGAVLSLININNWKERIRDNETAINLVDNYESEIKRLSSRIEYLEGQLGKELPIEIAATLDVKDNKE
ncbi:hypothetical protein [Sporosarcina highlanderae]|uniref:Uncharacterized protein n=1 Tax=Sporosarcina highlanderae TaxID=3035916 RepID=A0ABT8JQK9_9BACL|nr:hypothetical protein [Sporosarcina highlanderae]MDN4607354.1 hypothetical protein [Sporosarcina highlanderae]